VAIEFHRDGPWELPEGWVWARLGDVCRINEPVSFDELPDDQKIPFIPMAAVSEETGAVDFSQHRTVSQLRKGYTRFRAGDVIFAKITPCMENGKTAPLPEIPGGFAAGSTEFHVLRSPALESRYLWYWLVRRSFRMEAERNMSGSAGQLRVPAEHLRNAQIAIPPLAEQRRIVARIDELYAEIADGEVALTRACNDLGNLRRTLLKAVVTGKLTRDWRLTAGLRDTGRDVIHMARANTLLRKRRFHYGAPSTEIRLPEIPENWAWAQLGDFLYDIEAGVNVKADGRPPRKGEIGIVKISAVTWDEFDESESKTLPSNFEFDERNIIRPGDFLISRANTLELVAAPVIVKTCERRLVLSDKVLRLRIIEDVKFWVELCLKSPIGRQQIEHYASGNQLSMRNITQENIARLAIPIPPRDEMALALGIYAQNKETAEEGDVGIRDGTQSANSLRQSVLRAAFSGHLVEQDPRDQDADELLAKLSEQVSPDRKASSERVAFAAE
jgi:type I restriction enzyme S subunit